MEKIVGECTPLPPVKSILDMLGTLKKIEGYVVMENISFAVFDGKVEDAKIPIPDHMRDVFNDGDRVKLIVVKPEPEKIVETVAVPEEGS